MACLPLACDIRVRGFITSRDLLLSCSFIQPQPTPYSGPSGGLKYNVWYTPVFSEYNAGTANSSVSFSLVD